MQSNCKQISIVARAHTQSKALSKSLQNHCKDRSDNEARDENRIPKTQESILKIGEIVTKSRLLACFKLCA